LKSSEQTRTGKQPAGSAGLKELLESYERELIIDALKKSRGNAAAASRLLRTTERIINYRIKRLGIDPGRYRRMDE
jgi:Nif-specific regulatory protein